MSKLFSLKLIVFLILISQSSFSKTNLEPLSFADKRCRNISAALKLERDPTLFPGTRYAMNTYGIANMMTHEISALRDTMILAGDKRLNTNQALCNGVFNDGSKPNAYAFGHQAIAMGKGFIKKVKKSYGVYADDILYVVLFHEFAHSIQSLHKLKFLEVNRNKRLKMKEMQADCMSAIFMKMRGRYHSQTPIVFNLFAKMLGDKKRTGDHGTHKQRLNALRYGARAYDLYFNDRNQMHSQFILSKMCHQYSMRTLINNN